mmetsp:Transcript_5437/g.16083  ORF Transcript_5437/g.16083 Transcript_5437/m.16083 type:complete len:215 (+) Transcript_5437:925-1569(+)
MFHEYAAELEDILAKGDKAVSSLEAAGSVDAGEKFAKEAATLLASAGDLAKQLDVEVRSASAAEKPALREKHGALRDSVKALAGRLEKAREGLERQNLLGDSTENPLAAGASERGRLRNAAAKANEQNDRIRGALEIVSETEHVAMDITSELERNRETIASIRGHVADTSGSLGTARGLIAGMQKREVQQKVALTAVAAILIGSIGWVGYYSFG